jgi:Rrf2 family protein
MFSKACEYAIRSVLYIATNGTQGSKVSIQEIAREIDSPVPFTAKILQTLVREGVVSSTKGPKGGFYISPDAKPIPLNAVVNAIDGDDILHACSMGLKKCSDRYPCPIHHEVKKYKVKLEEILKEKTIQQLARELSTGKSFLRNGRK